MKRIVFCATPRTGSTMIFDDFRNVLGQWPADSEILYQEIINKRTEQDWASLWRDIQEPLTAGPVWAVKVMFHYLPYLSHFIAGGRLVKTPPIRDFEPERVAAFMRFFSGASFVHVRRRDVFAQAVSMYMAETTNIWEDRGGIGPSPERNPPPYDRARLLTYADELIAERQQWPKLFSHFGIDPHCIDYEDAATKYPVYLAPFLRQLNITPAAPAPPRRMFKIGDAVNDDYARRLRSDFRAPR